MRPLDATRESLAPITGIEFPASQVDGSGGGVADQHVHAVEVAAVIPAASAWDCDDRRATVKNITDEGVAVGGAFDSDTATGMMPAAQRVVGVLASWRS